MADKRFKRDALFIATIWLGLIALPLAVGCRVDPESPQTSTTEGLGGSLDEIAIPAAKSGNILKKFSVYMQKSATTSRRSVASGGGMLEPKQLRALTIRSYLRGLKEVGGLPRTQGAAVLRDLLSEDRNLCGGASCARVLGVASGEVEDVLDEAYKAVVANTSLAQSDRSLWQMLVGSLKPVGNLLRGITLDLKGATALIAKQPPRHWPANAARPAPILNQEEILARLTKEEQQAITLYSWAGFDEVRMYENSSTSELKAAGWNNDRIKSAALFSQTMDQAIRKIPVASGAVYRGIRRVEPRDVVSLVSAWQARRPIGLGPKNKPAVASSSWDPQVAKGFIFSKWNPAHDDGYGILFEIKQGHRGVAIEHIALHPSQKEILIPKSARFAIENIAPIAGESKVFTITLSPVP